ncbi:uncharacterized protein LOC126800346 [Argentina anserina]|uniref:uncharacterized protein LOC126800346 n=1 Tax=Argentina anserina TaxID=57926 RepID=UPI00217683DA|nr:uncharacterized protein LOC126800346 [Potentilla anserina]
MNPPISQLLLFCYFIILLCSSSAAVRSDSIIKMPTDSDSGACPGSSLPRSPAVCPVSCFRPDPVCGVDGVTYWCGCPEAQCAGVRVAKLGYCEVGSGGSAPQALLLVHIVWLIVLGFSVLFGIF